MTSTHSHPPDGDHSQRILEILRNFVVRLERQPRPHPELLEMAGFAVDRFMELTYAGGALQSCLEASKLSSLLGEMLQETQPVEQTKPRLSLLWSNLETVHALEMRREQAAEQAHAPAPSAPANGGGTAPANGGAAAAAPASAPPTPARPAGIPADGGMPEGARDGAFAYLGTRGFPYDAELTSIFLTEAGEQVPAVEAILLKIEKNDYKSDSINDLFRYLHTIKGNSGFLGLREFIRLVHGMEQYLEPFRNRSSDMSAFNTGLMLEGCDALKQLLANLQARVDALTSGEPVEPIVPLDWEALTERILSALPARH